MINRKLIAAVSVTVLFGCTVFATLSACSDRTSGLIDDTSYQSLEEQEYIYSESSNTKINSEENNSEIDNSAGVYTTGAGNESVPSEESVSDMTSQSRENTGLSVESSSPDKTSEADKEQTSGSSKDNTDETKSDGKETTSDATQNQSRESNTEHTTISEDNCDTESGENTQFVFTSIKISDADYDYYTYMVNKGYTPINDKSELSSHCQKNVLSLDSGNKGISYIITKNGLFDTLAAEMESRRSQAERTGIPGDVVNRDAYLYGELGLDYQTYYSRGIALFMIKKIQNVTNNKGDYSVYALYYYSYETKEQAQLVDGVVNQVVKSFSGTDYDKMMAAYDYLINNAQYADDVDESMAHTAYGALINGSAVCEGYAKAYKLMLDAMGITNEIVVNDIHAWNVVQYEGQWYVVDVTNGDVNTKDDHRCYAYFMLGRDVMYSAKNLIIDGYIFSSGTIAGYGYIDKSNTDIHELAEFSLSNVQQQ